MKISAVIGSEKLQPGFDLLSSETFRLSAINHAAVRSQTGRTVQSLGGMIRK